MKPFLKSLSIIFVFLFVSGCGLLFFIPKPSLLDELSFSTAIYDTQHHLLRLTLSQDDKYRLFTPLAAISPQLRAATLLQEDQYFRWHVGINPWALVKAGWQTYVLKSRRLGASTITMQLARIRFAINSKTWLGKIAQILRAIQLESYYSKNEILEAYLNLAPYGHNIEGVGAASLIYFSKSVNHITLLQALTLAVIPQNPGQRTIQNKDLQNIRNKLFTRWLRLHPQDDAKHAAFGLPLEMRSSHALPFLAPHFVNAVLKEVPFHTQQVITTLDAGLQLLLTRITRHYLARKKRLGVYNAAVLLVDSRDMAIKGLVGSADFFNPTISGQINGTDIQRSPGSTLKPFIYGLAMDQGLIHPNTVLKDVPSSFGGYNPENFDYDFMGPIKAKDALVLSRNIPAIYLANQLTHPNLYDLLADAQVRHLKAESYYGLALSLGGAELSMKELTSLYAMLLNDGIWYPLRTRLTQALATGKRMLSAEASLLVLDMLKDTPRPGNSNWPKLGTNLPIAWKTGTSSGYRDAWSIGTFGPYVLAVWLGNFDNKSNPAFVGRTLAAPLFFELIAAINHEHGPLPTLTKYPEKMHLKRLPVCKASGMLPTRYCHDTELGWFIPGKSPIKSDTIYREVAIDNQTGLRTCHVKQNTRFEVYEFWPSDLLNIFKQAGIQRRLPPPYAEDCLFKGSVGLAPQITSPQNDVYYIISTRSSAKMQIPLTAIVDADVASLHWFINERYLAKTNPNQPLLWTAKPGKYTIRVVDDHGLADARDIFIQMDN